MNKKKILIVFTIILLVIIIGCIIKIAFNNSNIEIASKNILTNNEESTIYNASTNEEQGVTNEDNEKIINVIKDTENEEQKDNENRIETKETKTDEENKSNKTTTNKNNLSSSNSSNNSNKTNNQSSNVNTTTNNKNNSSSTNIKEDSKIEENTEKKENIDKETEDTKDTEEKEETSTENSKLANTFFSEYNKQRTQEAVNYINQQMKKDEMYEELGGYAVAVTTKPTKNWMSYSSNSKLDGMALAGCKVSVYVENYYRYNSKGTDYYLYDTKIYVYQEVI